MTVIDGNALQGVSATTLWTLHNRASEANRPDGILTDPHGVRLYDAVDYDYLKFGEPNQSHALRAAAFDAAAAAYLAAHPKASVVALAEGLQTSFWRLEAAGLADGLTWYSIDLPPVIALREALLPHDDRIVNIAQSALDRSWMDQVDSANGVFLTAEGLFIYLDPAQVRSLIADCAARFPGGQLMFDSIPPFLSRKTLKGWKLTDRYQTPPMPFGLSRSEADNLVNTVPGVRAVHHVQTSGARGVVLNTLIRLVQRFDVLKPLTPVWLLLEFG